MRRGDLGGATVLVIALIGGGVGCDKGGEGAPAAISLAHAEVDSEVVDATPGGDALDAYCEGTARARCEWALECVGAVPALWTVFGLKGPDVARCVAPLQTACLADVRDREARGTLDLSEDAVQICVEGLRGAPCPDGPPTEWVEQWYAFAFARCSSVVRGTQVSGAGCEIKADCQDPRHVCAGGDCRAPTSADLQQECAAEGAVFGASNYDRTCPAELCVQPGRNAQGKAGLCSADCRDGVGCPGGDACLRTQAPGDPPTWFCVHPCETDGDCLDDLSCELTNPTSLQDRSKHCWVTAE